MSIRQRLMWIAELEYHPYVLVHLEPVLKIAAEHGILIEAFGPLTPVLRHPDGGPLKPVLERIAQRISKDSGQKLDSTTVLLLWTLQKGVVAVTTSKNEQRIKGLADVEHLPDLTAEEMEEIEKIGRSHHYRYYIVSYQPPDTLARSVADHCIAGTHD